MLRLEVVGSAFAHNRKRLCTVALRLNKVVVLTGLSAAWTSDPFAGTVDAADPFVIAIEQSHESTTVRLYRTGTRRPMLLPVAVNRRGLVRPRPVVLVPEC